MRLARWLDSGTGAVGFPEADRLRNGRPGLINAQKVWETRCLVRVREIDVFCPYIRVTWPAIPRLYVFKNATPAELLFENECSSVIPADIRPRTDCNRILPFSCVRRQAASLARAILRCGDIGNRLRTAEREANAMQTRKAKIAAAGKQCFF